MSNNFEQTAYDVLLNFWNKGKTSSEIYGFYSSLIDYTFYNQKINTEIGFGLNTTKKEYEIFKRQLTLNEHLFFDYKWDSIVLELTIEKSIANKLLDFNISFYFLDKNNFDFALKSFIALFLQKGGYLTKHSDGGVQINNSDIESMVSCISIKFPREKETTYKMVFSLMPIF